jgi:NADH-quinone oxidoreductase subunit N
MRGDPQVDGATQAILFYMIAYVFTAGGAFGLVAHLESQTGRPITIDTIRGLAKNRPGTAAALALFMLSLGGIPATGGFFGKYLVFSVLVRADMIAVAVIGVLLSVVALGYYLRVVVAMYMQPEVEGNGVPAWSRAAAGVMALVCVAMVLFTGLMPQWFFEHLK